MCYHSNMKKTPLQATAVAEQKVNNSSFWALVLASVATLSTLPYVTHSIQAAVGEDFSTVSGDLARLLLIIPATVLFISASIIGLVFALRGLRASDRTSKNSAVASLVLLFVINPGLVIVTLIL